MSHVEPQALQWALRGARIQAARLGQKLPAGDRPEDADLRQEAELAVLVAATRWRPDGGASFATYAWAAVLRALSHALRDWSPLPARVQGELHRGERAREPWMRPALSLDAPLAGPDGRPLRLGDCLPDPRAPLPERVLFDHADLRAAVAALPDARRREALILRYWHGWTDREIGERLGTNKQTVWHWRKRDLAALRALLEGSDG